MVPGFPVGIEIGEAQACAALESVGGALRSARRDRRHQGARAVGDVAGNATVEERRHGTERVEHVGALWLAHGGPGLAGDAGAWSFGARYRSNRARASSQSNASGSQSPIQRPMTSGSSQTSSPVLTKCTQRS